MADYQPDPAEQVAESAPSVQAERRRAEVDARVLYVRGLLGCRLFLADVMRLTRDKFKVNRATARKYVRLAKGELAGSTGLTRREHRRAALKYYATVVRASLIPRPPKSAGSADAPAPPPEPVLGVPGGFRATVSEGLEAQGAIDKLLGLAVDRDKELDALKATLRGLIAALEPHAAARAAVPAASG